MNKLFINPISLSKKHKLYSTPKLHTPELLTKALSKKGLNITLGNQLKGGTVSQVYEGILNDEKVVIKHTEDLTPFDPTEIFISKRGHNVDSKILKLLQNLTYIKVPIIIKHFPEITTTIMENVTEKGYELQSFQLLKGNLNQKSAENIGRSLANLVKESRKWKKIATNEKGIQSIYERGLELRLAYPNSQEDYLELEKEFINNDRFITFPDAHPKNIFINKQGEAILIDFGRSVYGDQRFILPNYLSHIAIYSMCGYYSRKEAVKYINNCINSYQKLEKIDEEIFCKYFSLEILHRMSGKWLSGIETADQKVKLFGFGLKVFDRKIKGIKNLIELFVKV